MSNDALAVGSDPNSSCSDVVPPREALSSSEPSERPPTCVMLTSISVSVAPGRAIDTMARPGATETEIDVSITQVGGLSLGSLLLSASRGGTTSLQLEFGSEPTARASFDIYVGTAGQRLSATLEVSR